MISCKDVREPISDSQRNVMKLVTRTYKLGSRFSGRSTGLYMYVVVVKTSRSLSHLLMSSCLICRLIFRLHEFKVAPFWKTAPVYMTPNLRKVEP